MIDKIVSYLQKISAITAWIALALVLYSFGRVVNRMIYRFGMLIFALAVAAVILYCFKGGKNR